MPTDTITNLDRAIRAELCVQDCYQVYGNGSEMYRETSIQDFISDLCHLLHLDEKTAGLKSKEEIRKMLDTAFNNFSEETKETTDA